MGVSACRRIGVHAPDIKEEYKEFKEFEKFEDPWRGAALARRSKSSQDSSRRE
jgi:hypothetical protein